MMQLAVITTGTLFGRVQVRPGHEGLLIGRDVLDVMGVRDGDELEVHSDGRMLVLVHPENVSGAAADAASERRRDDAERC
jgi:hypothetical protein